MNIGEKKEYVGYVGEYSDTWLFETDKTPYSSIVVLAIEPSCLRRRKCPAYHFSDAGRKWCSF